MTSPRAILGQDWTGELLFAVHGFVVPGSEASLPRAVSLLLGNRWLTLLGDPDDSLLHIEQGQFSVPADSVLRSVDLAQRDPWARFLHCPLYSWWIMENEMGSVDGLFLAFDARNGLLLLAQPAGLDILAVSGAGN